MITDPNAAFQAAAEACRRGDYVHALGLYRQLEAQLPGHPQILSAHGNAALAAGAVEEGIAAFRRSLAVAGAQADVWCNLARGLRQLQRLDEALDAVDRSLGLSPGLFPAWSCRGNILWDLGRLAEAVDAYQRAVALAPSDPRTHYNLANALLKADRAEEAVMAFQQALALMPDYPEAARNLASLLCDLKRPAEALPWLERAQARHPDDAALCSLTGTTLHMLGRFAEAVELLDRVVALEDGSAVSLNNRAVSEHALGRYDAALADFDSAIAHDAAYADAMVNRGTLLKDLDRYDEADAAYDDALAIEPAHPEASWNKGLLALLRGQYREGWIGYEGRWKSKASPGPYFEGPQPQWRGEDVSGKTVFVWSEQGYGDFIQFCRYIPLLAARGARVMVQVPERLKPLIAGMAGPFEMIGPGDRPAAFDYQCPLMSLPLAFGTTLDTVPAAIPYLSADPAKQDAFKAGLGPGPHIGLQWSANLSYVHGHTRHMPATALTPLLEFPARFHVLHKEFRPEDRAFLAAHGLRDLSGEQNDFSDAAALIAAMDLVISVDTVVPHLAGALGVPVFLMLPHAGDWRWLTDRTDTPWYPGMRLFRQPRHGDWVSVVGAVTQALALVLSR